MKTKVLAAMLLSSAMVSAQNISYPVAPQDGTVDTYFGVEVTDKYRPLEDDNSEATKQWVEAENKITQQYLNKIPQRKALVKRMKELVNYEKVGVPSWNQGKWYLSRNDGMQNQYVMYQMDEWVVLNVSSLTLTPSVPMVQ